MAAREDIELMQHADGELSDREIADIDARIANDPDAQTKLESMTEMGEIVRSHLELSVDDVPERRFDAMWRKIDRETAADAEDARGGLWASITRWFERHRGHVITGVVSAGAVATVALVLRGDDRESPSAAPRGAIDVQPAALRVAPEIESLDTPDGEGTVLNIQDEDGHTTVIWVSPADTVEGI